MRLQARPLTASEFAPFGEVLAGPDLPGRLYFDASLGNQRREARPSLSIAHAASAMRLPLEVAQLERHEFSSQSFVPIQGGRWLVIVCPSSSDGGPDVERALAFIAQPEQGVTYRSNVWHYPLTVLDDAACFAIFMWREGTQSDEEFRPVVPFSVDVSSI